MNIDVLKDLSPAEPASAGDLPPFGLFAAGVYPFLEFRWFHEAYYRVLELSLIHISEPTRRS